MNNIKKNTFEKLFLLGLLFTSVSAGAASIEGRAVGSFCCVLDAQGRQVNTVTNADGTITNANSGSPKFVISNNDTVAGGSSRVTWGTASNASMGTVNYFDFDGSGSDLGSLPGSTVANSLFQIGSFDYYNAATRQDNISGMTFFLDMDVINGSTTMSFPRVEFDLAIKNTPDNNDPIASQDFVSIASSWMLMADGSRNQITGAMQFELDGISYEFLLNGFAKIDPTTGLPYTDASGQYLFSNSTSAFENSLTEAAIFGTITQLSAVPLPAAIWMMGMGLMGLFGYARRNARR